MWVDPGEFGRGAAARDEARAEREHAVLEELLAAGWNDQTAADARRLHEAVRDVVAQWQLRSSPSHCNETALGLVGEARGRALAEWWAQARGLDEHARALLTECAGVVAAMAITDGYLLGRPNGQVELRPSPRASLRGSAPASGAPVNGMPAYRADAAVGTA